MIHLSTYNTSYGRKLKSTIKFSTFFHTSVNLFIGSSIFSMRDLVHTHNFLNTRITLVLILNVVFSL
jgi:hypothetical protein